MAPPALSFDVTLVITCTGVGCGRARDVMKEDVALVERNGLTERTARFATKTACVCGHHGVIVTHVGSRPDEPRE